MKLRLAVVLALVLGSSSAAFAQPMVTFGIKGGVGFGSVSSDDAFVDQFLDGTRTGMIVGGVVLMPVTPMLEMGVEVLYNQKGATGEFTELGQAGDITASVDYIQIPVLANINFQTMSNVRPFVNVGIAPAFKTSASFKVKFNGGETEDDTFDDDVESFDFGLIFGGGVRFGTFAVEGRYDLGLVSVIKEDAISDSVKSSQFAFLVTWFIG